MQTAPHRTLRTKGNIALNVYLKTISQAYIHVNLQHSQFSRLTTQCSASHVLFGFAIAILVFGCGVIGGVWFFFFLLLVHDMHVF